MDTKTKIVLGVLAGAAAGALLGVLMAPDKGSETRKKIMESGSDLSDEWKEKLDTFLAGLNEKITPVKDEWTEKEKSGKYTPTV